MNLQEQFEALPWWERPINQTSYHCDDLAKIVLAAIHILRDKYPNYNSKRMSPLNVWFTEYNPSKAAHNKAPIWDSRSCLVKTTRYSPDSVLTFSPEVRQNPGGHWFTARYIPDSDNSHRNYQMLGIATPTMRHFDREDPTETIRMGQGYAPKELIRQAVFYLALRYMGANFNSYGCTIPDYRFDGGKELWKEELSGSLQLRFDRKYRPKKSTLAIRQQMAYRMAETWKAEESLKSRQKRVKSAWNEYAVATENQKMSAEAYHQTLNNTSLYLLSLGQEAPNPTAKAVTPQDLEKDNA